MSQASQVVPPAEQAADPAARRAPGPDDATVVPLGVDVATLLQEDCAALGARFAAARWRGPVGLEGHPAGHMLAVPGFDRGIIARGLSAFGSSFLNPWRGKSFEATAGEFGTGTNRLWLAGLTFTAFRFKTYATASVVDGEPAFAIDYDTPDTPRYARATYDELRPVSPGLFLGRGMKRRQGKPPKLLVWFALDLNAPAAPVDF